MGQLNNLAFFNEEAESAVLAAMFKGSHDTAKYAVQLSAADFHKSEHKAIFQAVQKLTAAGKDVTTVTVSDALNRMNGSDQALVSFLPDMNRHILAGWAIDSHINLIRAASLRRELYTLLNEAQRQLMNPENDASAVLESTRQGLRDMVMTGHKWQEMPEVLLNAYEMLERRQSGEVKAMPSGLPVLDKWLGGFHRGEMTAIGARPGVGKSALGMFIALSTAKQGYRVGVVSREMTDVQYGTRILGSRTDIESARLRAGKIDPFDWTQLAESIEYHSGMNVSFMFTVRDVEDLRMEVQNKIDTEGMDMLIVDYLQLLQSKQRFEKDFLRIGYVSRMLKSMALDFNIPVIALAQVGRSSSDDMPTLAEFRGSGDVEQDADNVLFLHRPSHDADKYVSPDDRMLFNELRQQDKQYIVIDIAKQRQGETRTVSVVFDPQHMQYTGIARE